MTRFQPFKINLKGMDLSKPIHFSQNGIRFWLTKYKDKVHAFYDECAHMGGSLNVTSSGLVCSVHGWSYSYIGENINPLSPGLRRIRVIATDKEEVTLSLPRISKKGKSRKINGLDLSLSVFSHASIQFEFNKSKLLFDPWLKGRAYYGSWQLFPDANIDIDSLKPNAIILTHPHPDHFHIETLRDLDKFIPIYFPRFPSRLLERNLSDLGFMNINPLNWGQEFILENQISLEFLKPRSFWEDSATLVSIWDNSERLFSWLNLVDAGSVIDQYLLPEIDLLSSAFDQGASGYPLTWQHLSLERKQKLMKLSKANTQKVLINRALQLQPKYFLPFAGHWRLAMPQHQEYARMIEHTNFLELEQLFRENAPGTKLLGVYPGESVNLVNGEISENAKVRDSVEKGFNLATHSQSFGIERQDFRLSDFQLAMKRLVSKAEVFGVEHVIFQVSASDIKYTEQFEFISSRSNSKEKIYISVSLPTHILNLFAEDKANWDHIAIGYWGNWYRSPDVYPSNFMRLLQVGSSSHLERNSAILDEELEDLMTKSIGDLIEANPIEASRILTRIGLPCLSCVRSNSETLIQGLNIHQIDPKQVDWLIRELASLSSERHD